MRDDLVKLVERAKDNHGAMAGDGHHNTWYVNCPHYTCRLAAAVVEMDKNHCHDCCCARSWKALGDPEYDGNSIDEHIATLRAQLDAAREVVGVLKKKYAALRRKYLMPDKPTFRREPM